jgi:ligand-binding SRPBCC domain-containing protein
MPKIQQTLTLDCPAGEVFAHLLQPQEILDLHEEKPSLHLYCNQPLKGEGEIICNTLQYGLYQVKWLTQVKAYTPFSYLEHVLTEGPFEKWVHKQSFKSQGHKTVIEDEIHFEGPQELEELLSSMVISYNQESFVEERPKQATKKIQIIQKKLA